MWLERSGSLFESGMTAEDLALFRRGDDQLFARLVRAHSPRLLGAALHLTRDRSRAHDLVHDTWVRAFQARDTFSGAGSLLGWMLVLMRSCVRSDWRTETRMAAREQAVAVGSSPGASEHEAIDREIDAHSHRERLVTALAQLGERQRDVVVMRVLEERSVSDTARALGIAEGTVKATLSQALQRLRTLIAESFE